MYVAGVRAARKSDPVDHRVTRDDQPGENGEPERFPVLPITQAEALERECGHADRDEHEERQCAGRRSDCREGQCCSCHAERHHSSRHRERHAQIAVPIRGDEEKRIKPVDQYREAKDRP